MATTPGHKTKATTYRIREIHESFSRELLSQTLCSFLHLANDGCTIHTFAYDAPYGRKYRQKVATVTFVTTPELLKTGNRWTVELSLPEGQSIISHTVYLDKAFEHFTPLTPAELEKGTHIDCILIHGWAGHAVASFASPDGNWFWPRDGLCKDLPSLRVWLYGYSSNLRDSVAMTDVYEYADTFRRKFADARRDANGKVPARPSIFIVHSLGGWILKDAMIEMAQNNSSNDDKMNIEMIKGALLFGVPGLGMDAQRLVNLLQKDDFPASFTGLLLDKRRGFRLRAKQADDFRDACLKSNPMIYAFYEEYETPTVQQDPVTKCWNRNGPASLCVDQASATEGCTSRQNKIQWQSTHTDMLKLKRDDRKYETLLSRVREIVQAINESRIAVPAMTQDETECLQSLAFPEMDNRHDGIDQAIEGTCTWISQHSLYRDWLEGKDCILWIKGHPGTGKSTILKHILRLSNETPSNSIILSYFFHGRGTDLQKNLLGMYRSLLHQLISHNPSQLSSLASIYTQRKISRGPVHQAWNWQEGELRDYFQKYILEIAKHDNIHIYIDALDEAGEANAKNFVALLRFLSARDALNIAICFSCRHYPTVSFNTKLEICVEEENKDDIQTYITDGLTGGHLDTSYNEVREAILRKAGRSFQWASIVVNRILDLEAQGHGLRRMLDEVELIPKDLVELYRHLLGRLMDDDDRALSLRLFQWIVFARRPLTLSEMRIALVLKEQPMSFDACVSSPAYSLDDQSMRRRLRTLSGGLAECRVGLHSIDSYDWRSQVYYNGDLIQLIHQSVLDFLMLEGLAFLGCQLSPDVSSSSQSLLARLCLFRAVMTTDVEFISLDVWSSLPADELPDVEMYDEQLTNDNASHMLEHYRLHNAPELAHSVSVPDELWVRPYRWRTFHAQRFPLLEYSLNYFLNHLRQAQTASEPSFEAIFQLLHGRYNLLPAWIKTYRSTFKSHAFPLSYTILHIAVERKLDYLLTKSIEAGLEFNATDEDDIDYPPLQMAVVLDNLFAFRILLKQETIDVSTRDEDEATTLGLCVEFYRTEMVKLFLAQENINVHEIDNEGESALTLTVRQDVGLYDRIDDIARLPEATEEIVKLLLSRHDNDVNWQNHQGITALMYAVCHCDLAVVQLLLTHGAQVNIKNYCNETALHFAIASHGMLSDSGSHDAMDFDTMCSYKMEIVELLLKNGADVDAKTDYGMTPAMLATGVASVKVLKILLDRVEIHAQDRHGRTLLHYVPFCGRHDLGDEECSQYLGWVTNFWEHEMQTIETQAIPEIIDLILAAGVDPKAQTHNRETIAHYMIAYGTPDLIVPLLQKDIGLNSKDNSGNTLLHYVAIWEDPADGDVERVFKSLLGNGADPSLQNNAGTTAFLAVTKRLCLMLGRHYENAGDMEEALYSWGYRWFTNREDQKFILLDLLERLPKLRENIMNVKVTDLENQEAEYQDDMDLS